MTQCLAERVGRGAVGDSSGSLCGWKVQGYTAVDRLWVLDDHGIEAFYELGLCFGVDDVESSGQDRLPGHALVATCDSTAEEGGLDQLVPWYHGDILSEDGFLIQEELDRFASLAFWSSVDSVDGKDCLWRHLISLLTTSRE